VIHLKTDQLLIPGMGNTPCIRDMNCQKILAGTKCMEIMEAMEVMVIITA
jgi:hypothetical protein